MLFRWKQIKMTIILFLFGFGFSFAQTVTVTSPQSGQVWYKGQTYTITWTKSGTMNSKVKIRLYQGATKVLSITDSTENDGSFIWTIPTNLTAGDYFIRVKTIDNLVYGNSGAFRIADVNTYISIMKPYWGDQWYYGKKYNIQWNKGGTMASNVKIGLFRNNNKILDITTSTPNDGVYEWTIPSNLEQAGDYKIKVTTVDNTVSGESGVFFIGSSIKVVGGINVNLQQIPKADLEVYGTTLNFTGSKMGEVKFHVAVKNKGNKNVVNIPYILRISGSTGKYQRYVLTGIFVSLPEGMTVTLDKTFLLDGKGNYTFTFIVNPNLKAFPEYGYNNNKVTKTIYFKGLPDLIVSFIGVGMNSRIGFSHKITFEIKNIGDSSSSPCKLRTYIEGNGVKFYNVPSIAPGQIIKINRSAKWFKLGYKRIEAIIDYYNVVEEKNENNNKSRVKTKVITGTIFD